MAIKVLPESFSANTERVARFEREARLLATLSHQNIAGIYGFEETNGTRYLVLELVEGQTLKDHLGKASVPIEETLRICRQIADAVSAAHEQGNLAIVSSLSNAFAIGFLSISRNNRKIALFASG